MSKLTRALVVGATLAAMNLAGMTAVAQAQPPDGVEQFRRGERASQEQSTTAEAVEEFRRGERVASPEQTTADAALRRVLARERFSIPAGHPSSRPPRRRPSRAHSPTGSWLPSVALLPAWRWQAGWPCSPPGEPAAAPGSSTRPDQGHGQATR